MVPNTYVKKAHKSQQQRKEEFLRVHSLWNFFKHQVCHRSSDFLRVFSEKCMCEHHAVCTQWIQSFWGMHMFCSQSLLIFSELDVTDLFDLLRVNILAGLCILVHIYIYIHECLNQHINSTVDVLRKNYL